MGHHWIKLLLESHPASAKSAAARKRIKQVLGTKGMKRKLAADVWVGRSVSIDADLDRAWATEKGWATRAAIVALRDSWNADNALSGPREIAIGDKLHACPDGSQMQLEPPSGWGRLGFFNFVDLAVAEKGVAMHGMTAGGDDTGRPSTLAVDPFPQGDPFPQSAAPRGCAAWCSSWPWTGSRACRCPGLSD